jgi:hypothetical protein
VQDIVNVKIPLKKHVVYGWLIIVIGHMLTIIDWLTIMSDPCVAFEGSLLYNSPIFIIYPIDEGGANS